MSIVVLLIIFSLVVALIFLAAFIWAVKSGQYDDTYSPSVRMLFDNDDPKKGKEHTDTKSTDEFFPYFY